MVGAESQGQFDLMLRNAMIQFFNADVDVEKLCYTSMVTFGDDGVPSGDLRRISMADYKKMVKEGLKSYECEVKDMSIDLFQEVMDLFRNEARCLCFDWRDAVLSWVAGKESPAVRRLPNLQGAILLFFSVLKFPGRDFDWRNAL